MSGNFSLTFDFMGGAPGSGGTSRLSVTSSRGHFLIIDELLGEGPEFRRRGEVSVLQGWRGVVEHLSANCIVAYGTDGDTSGEYPWPASMAMRGRESIATDMVAMAWAGEPLLEMAQALAKHSDDDLEQLRARYGSLRSEAFVADLMRFRHWADELLVDPDDVLARAPRFGFDLRAMRRDLVHTARAERAEAEAVKLRRAWSLSPFQPQIDALVDAWRRANPATSGNTQMGAAVRAGAVRDALETFVLEHGRMPRGTLQAVPKKWVGPFTVDVDELLG